jgi:hypothetical protein
MTRTHLSKHLISWASLLEENTREQAVRTSTMPFIYPHLALMPDAHLGKGATVGSVIPTLGAIIPAAVGVDIGCGMIAVRTQWTEEQVRAAGPLTPLREAIEGAVPVSAGSYNTALTDTAAARVAVLEQKAERAGFSPDSYAGSWRMQLGSLGSGNHFIEVSVDETGAVWLFLHSGSRGIGNKIALHHIAVAAELCRRWWITLPDPDLAYLGAGLRRRQPRGDDGSRRRRDLRAHGRAGGRGRARQLPPQLHRAGEALQEERLGLPQGRDPGRRRRAGADPRIDGHRVLRGGRQGRPAVPLLQPARGRAPPLPVRRAQAVHPRAAA